MRAVFSVLLPDGLVLTATGKFPDHGASEGVITCHPKLDPWIRTRVCNVERLESLVSRAAVALGGAVSVLYLSL